LNTTYTEITGQTTARIPEFSAVTTLDGQQIDYYDSDIKKLIPKQDWMKDYASTDMWKEDTEIRKHVHQIYRNNIPVLMERFSQTHGERKYILRCQRLPCVCVDILVETCQPIKQVILNH